jgi:hypothetical protein
MPLKSVAVEADVVLEATINHSIPTWQGAWSASSVTTRTYAHLSIDASPLAYEVTVVFSYEGIDTANNNATVTDSSTVTLSAAPTILTYGGGAVLVHGDAADDEHGNVVRIAKPSETRLPSSPIQPVLARRYEVDRDVDLWQRAAQDGDRDEARGGFGNQPEARFPLIELQLVLQPPPGVDQLASGGA